MRTESFSRALSQWKKALGDKHVLTDPAVLQSYANNVSGLKRVIPAVLKPASTEEVRQLVLVANEFKVPLYPLSCGRNWGLGSRLPAQDGTVVVDLGRMDRIREVNVAGHYAVVEPGVTQGRLFEHLRLNNLPLLLNVTGSAAGTSLIGNALERGIGYFSSRADSLSALEVVLGNGTVIRTGFSHCAGAKTAYLYRHGIGPSLDGLFAQSNFGIVTAAAVDLIPKRDAQMAVVIRIDHPGKLASLIDALAGLRRRDVIQTVFHVGNRERTRIALAPLIYGQLKGWAGTDDAELRSLAESLMAKEGFGPWSAVGGIMGTPAQLRLARREIRRAVRGIGRAMFLNDALVGAAKRLGSLFSFVPWVRTKLTMLLAVEPLYNLAMGVPSDCAMRSVYWPLGRMPDADSDDPDQGACGMLYCVPFLPADGRVAHEAMDHAERVFRKHGFIPFTTLNLVDSRSLEAVINLAFDREKPEQVAAAHVCNDELTADFIRQGFMPYRVGVQSMSLVVKEDDPFWQTVRELKKALDPNGVISPGRYNLA